MGCAGSVPPRDPDRASFIAQLVVDARCRPTSGQARSPIGRRPTNVNIQDRKCRMRRRATSRHGGDYNSWTRPTRPNETGEASMENVFKINGARIHSSTTIRSLHNPIAVNGEDWQTVVAAPGTEQPTC